MNIYGIVALFNALVLSGLAVLMLNRSAKKSPQRYLGFLILMIGLWSLGYFLWQTLAILETAEYWLGGLMFFLILVPYFYINFIYSFLGENNKHKFILYLTYALTFIFSIISLTGLLTNGVRESTKYVNYPPNASVFFDSFILFFGIYIFYGIALLTLRYKQSSPLKKQQIKYIIIGTLASYLTGITNYFMWFDVSIPPVGNFIIAFFLFVVIYALITRHLLDIHLVLKKSTVYLLSVTILFLFAASMKYLGHLYLPDFILAIDFAILISAVFAYPIMKKWLYRISNKYFETSFYKSSDVMSELSEKLGSTLNIDSIYKYLDSILVRTFHPSALAVFIYNPEKKEYFSQYNNGFNLKHNSTPNVTGVFEEMMRGNECVLVEEGLKLDEMKGDKVLKAFSRYGADIIVPMNLKDRIVGILVLGRKKSDDIYNDEDMVVLRSVGSQVSIAIDHALKYQEVKYFNVKLEREVEKATHELKEANRDLRKLDEAKTEFISIASHQLRTPLTAIRGYIDLIETGFYGKLSKKMKEALDKIVVSNDRLVSLVENLLNVSRIESGVVQYKFGKCHIEEILKALKEEFEIIAKEKNLKFKLSLPSKSLPPVYVDKMKLTEAISNIMDNAIKYTEKGGISIKVGKVEDFAIVEVVDSGLGIPKKEFESLFMKFLRGDKQKRAYVEGVGIGLYITKEYVEAQGGKVWAASKGLNKGTRFYVKIPFAKKT